MTASFSGGPEELAAAASSAKHCSVEQFSVLIHSASLRLTRVGFTFFFFFLSSLLPLVRDFHKQPIFLMEALTVSCFLSLPPLTHCLV